MSLIYLLNALMYVGASTQVTPGPRAKFATSVLYGLVGLNVLGWFLS